MSSLIGMPITLTSYFNIVLNKSLLVPIKFLLFSSKSLIIIPIVFIISPFNYMKKESFLTFFLSIIL